WSPKATQRFSSRRTCSKSWKNYAPTSALSIAGAWSPTDRRLTCAGPAPAPNAAWKAFSCRWSAAVAIRERVSTGSVDGMSVPILVAVKLRLLWRSFMRQGGRLGVVAIGLMVLFLSPMSYGLARGTHGAITHLGADGLASFMVTLQFGWLAAAFLFA